MKTIFFKKKGVILPLVLWVLFFLSVLAVGMGVKSRMHLRLRSLKNESLRVYFLAKEALHRGLFVLMQDEAPADTLRDSWAEEFSLQKEEALLSYKIIDEDRFMNINTVSAEIITGAGLFFPELTEEAAAEIVSRRPYNTLRELLSLTQVDAALLYTDTAGLRPGLADICTVFSDGRININTAPPQVLLLLPEMTRSAVDAIVAHRSNEPFAEDDALSRELSRMGLTAAQTTSLVKFTKVRSSFFRIAARAVSGGKRIEKSIEVVVRRDENGCTVLWYQEK